MGMLIDDLLAFSRLGRQSLSQRATVDMGQLVREVLEELLPEWQGRKVDLRIPELLPADGDVALLKQVWVNLLSNALKYTRRREVAVIEVGSEVENGETVYFVRDNGTGFDTRYAKKLFGVFQRLHRARISRARGSASRSFSESSSGMAGASGPTPWSIEERYFASRCRKGPLRESRMRAFHDREVDAGSHPGPDCRERSERRRSDGA
jgi:light-regulated signal transduction histidine kinase (bacteriophytochrome)